MHTIYVDFNPPTVNAAWLNDVDVLTYIALGSGGVAPATAIAVLANLFAAANAPFTLNGGAWTPTVAIPFSATPTINCNLSNVFSIGTLTGPVAPVVSNPHDGQTINVRFTQDGSGNRTWTVPPGWKTPGGTPALLSTAAGAVDLAVATYYADTTTWIYTLLKGIA